MWLCLEGVSQLLDNLWSVVFILLPDPEKLFKLVEMLRTLRSVVGCRQLEEL